MNIGKVILIVLGILVALSVAGWVVSVVAGILKILIPVAIVLAIGYGVYKLTGKDRSLGGSGRSLP